jgi:hypothetical protein
MREVYWEKKKNDLSVNPVALRWARRGSWHVPFGTGQPSVAR